MINTTNGMCDNLSPHNAHTWTQYRHNALSGQDFIHERYCGGIQSEADFTPAAPAPRVLANNVIGFGSLNACIDEATHATVNRFPNGDKYADSYFIGYLLERLSYLGATSAATARGTLAVLKSVDDYV